MSSLRVLLVEDHRVVREGLRALLEHQPDMEVVGEAGDSKEALRMAGEFSRPLRRALGGLCLSRRRWAGRVSDAYGAVELHTISGGADLLA